ncbi:hypothetical protein G6011_1257 [Alternaria panax]|uniref:Uncharacterized protein n=1 Tax=Alternaria panax TaxID=48097 RepID=A0AAD4IJJ8_9PLEO|nr:hypothetical protein G6011_1257 [Alternaria panax]
MANMTPQPFRLLDLPTKLRFMRNSEGATTSSFTIITYTAPTVMLATCKIVKNEFEAIIPKTTQQFLPGQDFSELGPAITGIAPRIETDGPALHILGAQWGLIKVIFHSGTHVSGTSSTPIAGLNRSPRDTTFQLISKNMDTPWNAVQRKKVHVAYSTSSANLDGYRSSATMMDGSRACHSTLSI